MSPRKLTLAYAACQILSVCFDIGALIASAMAAYGSASAGAAICKPGSGNEEICRFPIWALSAAIVGHLSLLAYSGLVVLGPVTATQTTAGVLIGGACLAAELAPSITINAWFETSSNAGWRAGVALMYTAAVISVTQLLLILVSRKRFKKTKESGLSNTNNIANKSPISNVESSVSFAAKDADEGGFGMSKLRKSLRGMMSLGRRKREQEVLNEADQYPQPYNTDDASPYAVSNVFGLRDQQQQQQQQSYDDNSYHQPYYGSATANDAAANNPAFVLPEEQDVQDKARQGSRGVWPYSTTEI